MAQAASTASDESKCPVRRKQAAQGNAVPALHVVVLVVLLITLLAPSPGEAFTSCGLAWRPRAEVPTAPERPRALAGSAHRPCWRQACIVLRAADDGAEDGPPTPADANATAAWEKDLGMELLRAKRPKGVDDFVEGILQAPGTDTLFQQKVEADAVYPAYDSKSEDGGVGNRIGLEKNTGDYSGGLFADRRREPVSGRDQIRETENNFVGAFAQEKNFIGGLIGLAVLALFYVSVYNGNGGTMDAPRYGSPAVPPGKGKVIERYEEAFVCYGVPTPEDPNGCRDKRSVGPVRVFSREPVAEGPSAAPDIEDQEEEEAGVTR